MKKRKLKITIEKSDYNYFIASDKIFYDYGIGNNLQECLLDYVQTIKERTEITKPSDNVNINEKLDILKEFLKSF